MEHGGSLSPVRAPELTAFGDHALQRGGFRPWLASYCRRALPLTPPFSRPEPCPALRVGCWEPVKGGVSLLSYVCSRQRQMHPSEYTLEFSFYSYDSIIA